MKIENITKHKEYFKLLLYFLVLVLITPSLINIIVKAWSIDNSLIRLLASHLWVIDHSSMQIIINIIMGFFVGSLVLMLIDTKKRMQSLILSVCFLYLAFNILVGNLLPNVDWSKYFIWFFIGVVIGFLLGDGKKLLLNETEFPKAAKNITTLSWVVITVCLFSYYFSLYFMAGDNASNLTGSVMKDSFSTIIFIIFLKEFIDYEPKDVNVFILGPKDSGKSLFMAGIYLKAMGTSKKPTMPNKGIRDLLKALEASGWPPSTKETKEYSFIHHYGTLFPNSIELTTIDYMGSYFQRISTFLDRLYNTKVDTNGHKSRTSDSISKGQKESESKFSETEATTRQKESESIVEGEATINEITPIARRVYVSSKLVLILDGAKFPNTNAMEISEFISILNFFNKNKIHKDFYIVVTKCDIFCDEFKATTNKSLDNNTYDEFQNFIYDKFTQNLSIRQLLLESQVNVVYPVFYYTKKDEFGNTIPVKDEFNNLYTFGFDYFMDAITL